MCRSFPYAKDFMLFKIFKNSLLARFLTDRLSCTLNCTWGKGENLLFLGLSKHILCTRWYCTTKTITSFNYSKNYGMQIFFAACLICINTSILRNMCRIKSSMTNFFLPFKIFYFESSLFVIGIRTLGTRNYTNVTSGRISLDKSVNSSLQMYRFPGPLLDCWSGRCSFTCKVYLRIPSSFHNNEI